VLGSIAVGIARVTASPPVSCAVCGGPITSNLARTLVVTTWCPLRLGSGVIAIVRSGLGLAVMGASGSFVQSGVGFVVGDRAI
jgi:hypothetical protein